MRRLIACALLVLLAPRAQAGELFASPFFRSQDDHTVLRLPAALTADGVELRLLDDKNGHIIAARAPKLPLVAMIVPSVPHGKAGPDTGLDAQLGQIAAGAGFSLVGSEVKAGGQKMPGGSAYEVLHMGPKGLAAASVIVSDGDTAAVLLVAGKTATVDAIARSFAALTRVGVNVPRLPVLAPKPAFTGVYATDIQNQPDATLAVSWMTFDPRGYLHFDEPDDLLAVDFDAAYANAVLSGGWFYAYKKSGDKLLLSPISGPPGFKTAVETHPFAASGANLGYDGRAYHRVDGLIADGTRLAGSYEFYQSSSTGNFSVTVRKHYVFGKDGSVAHDGSVIMNGNQQPIGASPGYITSGMAQDRAWRGSYVIAGNLLTIQTADKQRFGVPIFATHDNGKPEPHVLVIGGLTHSTR